MEKSEFSISIMARAAQFRSVITHELKAGRSSRPNIDTIEGVRIPLFEHFAISVGLSEGDDHEH
jgi:hypothetical protein